MAVEYAAERAAPAAMADVVNGTSAENMKDDLDTPTFASFSRAKINNPLNVSPKPAVRSRIDGLLEKHNVADVDPFALVSDEIHAMADEMKVLLGSDHPVLQTVVKHFFGTEGKMIRPTMVLLMSRALRAHEPLAADMDDGETIAKQKRLGLIAELIHSASLLHDDVIDGADYRRGISTVSSCFGNKVSILAGDYLLSRASVSLSRLRNVQVVECVAKVIEDLVKGEIVQMMDAKAGNDMLFQMYLKKNYLKTASLFSHSLQATAMLGGHSTEAEQIAFEYGDLLGQSFQIQDDLLDFAETLEELGKMPFTDLQSGLATAPVLYAQAEYPELHSMIARKFQHSGDVDAAATCVKKSEGVDMSRSLAHAFGERSVETILKLSPSPERDALARLVTKVLDRKK
jgi:geranylgeranyl pyrophosphate synthase